MCREARARCFREGSNIDGRSEPPFRLCSRKVFAMSPKKKAKKKSSAKKKTSKKAATTKKSKTAAKKGPAKKAKSSVKKKATKKTTAKKATTKKATTKKATKKKVTVKKVTVKKATKKTAKTAAKKTATTKKATVKTDTAVAEPPAPKRKSRRRTDQRQLKVIRETLIKKKDDLTRNLRSELNELEAPDKHHLADLEEMASDANDTDSLCEIMEVGVNTLEQVDTALRKLDDGTYGVCEACDTDIPIARLEALPFASLCIPCKEKEEKGLLLRKEMS